MWEENEKSNLVTHSLALINNTRQNANILVEYIIWYFIKCSPKY